MDIITTPCYGKMKHSIKVVGEKSPVPLGEILVSVRIFSSGGENLLRSNLDHSNLFQCLKQLFVNIEHQCVQKV